MESTASTTNTQLVDSLIQVILALSSNERALLLDRLLGEVSYPSTTELIHLTEKGGSFDFWQDEPERQPQPYPRKAWAQVKPHHQPLPSQR